MLMVLYLGSVWGCRVRGMDMLPADACRHTSLVSFTSSLYLFSMLSYY